MDYDEDPQQSVVTEFLARVPPLVLELLRDTADKMVELFDISRAEAVARINAQWEGQEFLESSDIVLHEGENYWAPFIYFDGDLPMGWPDGDRSTWTPRPSPEPGSAFWTLDS